MLFASFYAMKIGLRLDKPGGCLLFLVVLSWFNLCSSLMLYFRFKSSFGHDKHNLKIFSLIHIVDFLSFFSQMVSFFFLLSLCSFGLCSAPLPPARRIHDKAWRPAVDTGPSDTGSLLTALAAFSTRHCHISFPLKGYSTFFGNRLILQLPQS